MSQTIESHIREFLQYLQYQKRYSRHTITSYQTDLQSFNEFLARQFGTLSLDEVKSPFIRSWLASLKEEGITSKTINRKISSLKSFFKYHIKKEVIASSPMSVISSPKSGKRLPQYVDQKDMALLFDHVEFPDTWDGMTEKLVIQVFYNAGIRLSELIQLQDHHFDAQNSGIKVLGKGNKERIIPVSNQLGTWLRDYISKKNEKFPNLDHRFLLVSEKGKKLYPKYVYNLVKKYLSLVTTIEKKSPHILRHSFATHLTNNGADINAVKELMGHSSLAATQIYTHNSIEKLKEAFKKAHPKA